MGTCEPFPARADDDQSILADTLNIERWRVLAFTYAFACLHASWWLERGGDDIVAWALKVAVLIEPHLGLSG